MHPLCRPPFKEVSMQPPCKLLSQGFTCNPLANPFLKAFACIPCVSIILQGCACNPLQTFFHRMDHATTMQAPFQSLLLATLYKLLPQGDACSPLQAPTKGDCMPPLYKPSSIGVAHNPGYVPFLSEAIACIPPFAQIRTFSVTAGNKYILNLTLHAPSHPYPNPLGYYLEAWLFCADQSITWNS